MIFAADIKSDVTREECEALCARPLAARCLAGAKLLGEIWRGTEHTLCGWGWCACHPPAGRWCTGKRLWLRLISEAGRVVPDGPFALLESMSLREADATGVTAEVEIAGRRIRVGAKGGMSWLDFPGLMEDPESAKSILLVLGTFEGSRIQKEAAGATDRVAQKVDLPVHEAGNL